MVNGWLTGCGRVAPIADLDKAQVEDRLGRSMSSDAGGQTRRHRQVFKSLLAARPSWHWSWCGTNGGT